MTEDNPAFNQQNRIIKFAFKSFQICKFAICVNLILFYTPTQLCFCGLTNKVHVCLLLTDKQNMWSLGCSSKIGEFAKLHVQSSKV